MASYPLSRIPCISGREAIKVLSKAGWKLDRKSDSHVTLTRHGSITIVTVPLHGELAKPTLKNILKTAGLTIEDFEALR
jgi:predicted RNA binding protein YcfA (HicA-like mRNA interferase family)